MFNDTWSTCIVRCPRRIGGGTQRWRRRSWGTAAWRTSRNCLAATPTRFSKVAWTSSDCPRTPLLDASVKKGGRKKASCQQPELLETLREIVEVHTAGSPVEPGKLWTNRSPQELSEELSTVGFSACPNTVTRLLREELELSQRSAAKTVALGESADRDAQFERIAELKKQYLARGWPVISIDTKKKELLGNFFRLGRGWTNGRVRVFDHDFPSASSGKVIPYGVYDVGANEGFVLLADGADTGELACDALRRWWFRRGVWRYPMAEEILALADCGGSNGYRLPLFREALCGTARRIGRSIRVAHLPPYCSKYNPIDHRLFCHLTRSLQGLLCRSIEVVRDAFARTTTSTGLNVVVELARRTYQAGVKATDDYLAHELVRRDNRLPLFNYVAPCR